MAGIGGVTTRTIRRDLNALQEAGFPLYDERAGNRVRWFLSSTPFPGLGTTGFTLSELCALYLGRTLVDTLAGMPFKADVERAFDKFDRALSPRMRAFLDKLPRVVGAKVDRPKKGR